MGSVGHQLLPSGWSVTAHLAVAWAPRARSWCPARGTLPHGRERNTRPIAVREATPARPPDPRPSGGKTDHMADRDEDEATAGSRRAERTLLHQHLGDARDALIW